MAGAGEAMDRDELLDVLRRTGVLREGHFRLTSGRHSPTFLLCAQLLQYPREAERICRALAAPFRDAGIQAVVGPAAGGVILAYEVARVLGEGRADPPRALFTEKDDGAMVLRRGFGLAPGERVLMVEDAITTGGSVALAMAAIEPFAPTIVGVSVIVDRSAGQVDFGVPLASSLSLDIPSWTPEDCPLCRDGVELVLPKT